MNANRAILLALFAALTAGAAQAAPAPLPKPYPSSDRPFFRLQQEFLTHGLRLVELTPDGPDGWRFRWTAQREGRTIAWGRGYVQSAPDRLAAIDALRRWLEEWWSGGD
jgi:hypothetical protein